MLHHCLVPQAGFGQAGSCMQHRASAPGRQDRALSITLPAAQQASAGLLAPLGSAEGVWHRMSPFCFTPRDGFKDAPCHLSYQNQLCSPNNSSVCQKPYQMPVIPLQP